MKSSTRFGLVASVALGLGAAGTALGFTPVNYYTFAGTAGVAGSVNGATTNAQFSGPWGVAIGPTGNLYVTDNDSHCIRVITPAGVVSTLAGMANQSGSDDGAGAAARFNHPRGIAVDDLGNVFVADTYNHAIRKISSSGSVSTLAGLPGSSGFATGTGSVARFSYPVGLALDRKYGILYVADSGNNAIRKITLDGYVSIWTGSGGIGSQDGGAWSAEFHAPSGLAMSPSQDYVYVADTFNHTIRKIDTLTATTTTIAGLAGFSGTNDGVSTTARFYQPRALTVDASNNVYVADSANSTIRRVTSDGVVQSLSHFAGYADGSIDEVRFSLPSGIAVSGQGDLWITDVNNVIRKGNQLLPQLYFQTDAGQIASWVLNTNGVFQFGRILQNTGGWKIKTAGDIDGDDISDLVFQDTAGNTVAWLMHGDGRARQIINWGNNGAWEAQALGDYEGIPGRRMLLFRSPGGDVAFWTMDTSGHVWITGIAGNFGPWKPRAIADLDGDGKGEVFWQTDDGHVAIWFHGAALGEIRGYYVGNTGTWALRGAVDVDENGIADLAWQEPIGLIAGWNMNANGTCAVGGLVGYAEPIWKLKAVGR